MDPPLDTEIKLRNEGLVVKMIQSLESENVSTRTLTSGDDIENSNAVIDGSGRNPEESESDDPKDFYNLVYLIVLLNGIGCLMPWNLFITIAPEYYSGYKFMNRTFNGTDFVFTKTSMSASFLNYMTLCAQSPCLLLNFANIFVQLRGGLAARITTTISIVMAMLIVTMCFIYIETWSWINVFYALTMVTVFILNAANGVYQNSLFGLLAEFPFTYTNAVVVGNNLCGIIVTLMQMVAFNAARDDGDTPQLAALIYFSTALIVLTAGLAAFISLRKLPFYKYYVEKAAKSAAEHNNAVRTFADYKIAFLQGWKQYVNVYLVFLVSLTVFPSMMVETTDNSGLNGAYDFFLPEDMFTPVTTFLLFNVFAFVGSFIAGKIQAVSPSKLWIPVVVRLLLIPFFFFCNYKYDIRKWPVLFTNTWAYIAGGFVLSISSGYLSSLGMMYSSIVVEESRRAISGMMAAFSLMFGIVSGLLLNLAISTFVKSVGPSTARAVPL